MQFTAAVPVNIIAHINIIYFDINETQLYIFSIQ